MIERCQVQVPARVVGEFSSPVSAFSSFCVDFYFSINETTKQHCIHFGRDPKSTIIQSHI